ncbi:unnamed protein product [Hermetia illucens]|uniref:Asteroid domain-containing protein n=1 Tax=Hermetia illucens TaxID=343691 RepID=A0A7R8Z0T8_HERIL|nr:uncharacterized protein LOC119660353 [Hermetia illucens]CAD7091866.1 unnamed protein product [Hermetia illucens]
MGVRGLQTFLRTKVKDGVVPIEIADEVEKYKRSHNGKKPLIVIDLLTLQSSFHENNEELILGGRYDIYAINFQSTMRKLDLLDVELAFFIDGTSSEDKIPKRLERRIQEYNRAAPALSEISSFGFPTESTLSMMNLRLPTPFLTYIPSLAREFGTVHVSVLNDCDVEAAEYATKNDALAILTNDTDYLIFEGPWHFWSSTDLNINTLTTNKFNRDALRAHLNLRSEQMAIMATLAGNDFVSSSSFPDFNEIAWLIQSKNLSVNDYKTISGIRPDLPIDSIKASLKSYSYSALNKEYPSDLLKVASQSSGIMNYAMLADRKLIISAPYFDLAKSDMQPFFDLIRPLLRRVMGILLRHEHGPVSRTFYGKLHPMNYEKIILEPEYPPDDVPPLTMLLADNEELDSNLDETRMKLACWAISPVLTLDTFRQLPPKKVAFVTTLFYLVKKGQISIDEADCLLLACGMCKKQFSGDKSIKERDARIAFLFTYTLVYIQNCYHAVGLKKFCLLVPFNGVVFHYFRKKWDLQDRKYKDEVMKPFIDLRIYDMEN